METLLNYAKETYDNNGDPSHDFAHIERVINTCKKIGEIEGADLDVLIPAAILHDIINVPKNSLDRVKASHMAAEAAVSLLNNAGITDDEKISKIKQVIVEHSYSLGLKPSSIESAILQDADRLDTLGAIGIMRTVTVGARMGAKYYDRDEPFLKAREYDDKKYTIDHFYTKLFKLPALMNTDTGKLEAKKRLQFMQAFIEQFKTEI